MTVVADVVVVVIRCQRLPTYMLSDEAENSARGTHHGRLIRRFAETVEWASAAPAHHLIEIWWAGAIAGPTLLITPLHKLASRRVDTLSQPSLLLARNRIPRSDLACCEPGS